MTFSKTLLFASLLSIQSISNADDSQHSSSAKDHTGFGVGAIIGGLLAGPPGAIIGAAGGSWFGNRQTEAERIIAKLEKELNAKSIELAFQQKELENELATTKTTFQNELQHVVHNQEIKSLEKLSQGISYVIYYKTNDDNIRQDIRPQIKQLIKLIKPYPQIQVQIEGHADSRGSEQYNMALSKKRINKVRAEFINAGIPAQRLRTHAYGEKQTRATKGDTEAYVFDRRVTINLTLDREV